MAGSGIGRRHMAAGAAAVADGGGCAVAAEKAAAGSHRHTPDAHTDGGRGAHRQSWVIHLHTVFHRQGGRCMDGGCEGSG